MAYTPCGGSGGRKACAYRPPRARTEYPKANSAHGFLTHDLTALLRHAVHSQYNLLPETTPRERDTHAKQIPERDRGGAAQPQRPDDQRKNVPQNRSLG